MLILPYLLLLVVVLFLTRSKSDNSKLIFRLGFNFLVVFGMNVYIRITGATETNYSDVLKEIAASLYYSAQSMTFNGNFEWLEGLSPCWQAQIISVTFIASIISVGAVLVAIFGKFLFWIKFRVRGCKKTQYIIVGDCEYGKLIIDSIYDHVRKPSIAYIHSDHCDAQSDLYRKCRIENDTSILNRLKPNKKVYQIVLLPTADSQNIDILLRLDKNYKSQNIHVTAFLPTEFVRYHDLKISNIDYCVLSVEQTLIQRYFENDSPFTLLDERGAFKKDEEFPLLTRPFNLCLIGFGNIGREFLLCSYENCAFLTEDRKNDNFRAVVIDKLLNVKKEQFFTNAPFFAPPAETEKATDGQTAEGSKIADAEETATQAAQSCGEEPAENSSEKDTAFNGNSMIDFVNAEIGSPEYYKAIEDHVGETDQYVIATGDTQTNIETAFNLCRFFDRLGRYTNRPRIVVIIYEEIEINAMFGDYPNVCTLNVNEKIMDYATLIERNIDIDAKALHQAYLDANKGKSNLKQWNELSLFVRLSNRSSAFDMRNKKHLFDNCKSTDERRLEFLAEYEHNRWMAFHHAHGWKRMTVDELSDIERKEFATKHGKEKRHICLVSWKELDNLPQKSPGFKFNDRASVLLFMSKMESDKKAEAERSIKKKPRFFKRSQNK